jgi:hypothetical protein
MHHRRNYLCPRASIPDASLHLHAGLQLHLGVHLAFGRSGDGARAKMPLK